MTKFKELAAALTFIAMNPKRLRAMFVEEPAPASVVEAAVRAERFRAEILSFVPARGS